MIRVAHALHPIGHSEGDAMEESWFALVDTQGVRARAKVSADDPSSLEVELPAGERVFVASVLVHATQNGERAFENSFQACLERAVGGQVVVPVYDEFLEVTKRRVEHERVQLNTTVSTRSERVDVPLLDEQISIRRVPIGRVVQEATGPRQEGNTFIVPVYEEALVIEKRLILKEEVHVTRTRQERREPKEVTLRREELVVERVPLNDTES
jgi:uncharacterized protein (TIGR02271 family)